MSFGEKLGRFLIFVLLTIITAGLYMIWWGITMVEEQNALLREIRDLSRAGR